jgi:hypothetical protein
VGRASEWPALRRSLTDEEFREAIQVAEEEGITRLDERRRAFVLRWL